MIKMQLENLKGFEFECEKCGCSVHTSRERNLMIAACPDCGEGFYYDDMEDPIAHIQKALRELKKVRGVRVKLICEEVEI